MQKIVSKSLLTLVGTLVFVLPVLPSKLVLSRTTPTSAAGNDSTGGSGTINSPDLKVTQHIRHFDVNSCTQEVSSIVDIADAYTACFALNQSANNEPPSSFDSSSWANFKNSKEYRGYIHIPSIKVACSGGLVMNYTKPQDESNYGYTKVPVPVIGTSFADSDVYKQPNYNFYAVQPSIQGNYLAVTDQRASRVSHAERYSQYLLTTYDAPFIYTNVEEDIYCNGTIAVRVNRSEFPTVRLYVNDRLQSEGVQTKLADFIKSGGKKFNDDGYGNLAPAGAALSWSVQ